MTDVVTGPISVDVRWDGLLGLAPYVEGASIA